ncbi:3-oxoacyl-[acyl-carrier protein] reductase [Pseudonocardia hierapolitana]|uniref:3-oxoacyl-[acyl-carrier protein] reductase n=1 Tax=Pseudonocardia hierapolitana TaxID=1128676 RepID=A0A561SMH9_9PSEU|nr:SDR family NAD(P)-dependent oxidoreductase [Pseudonocardia hierapolitana]TWF76060.1 3-oxoacyl-[acyl-carrier protein] reductase [Pseudonocardia hierapolitana]
MLDFTGQVVLVTGAGSGIGAAVAEGFGRHGAQVVVHYGHNRDGAEKVAATIQEAGGQASVVSADLARPAAAARLVHEVVSRHGRLDVLVNNAGDLLGRMPVTEMSDEQFTRVMDLNMTSVFAACREAVPVMQRQGAGAVVNLTSVAARTGGAGGSVAYATAKGAVSTFTRGLAKEVARTGIRVNAIAPGIIVTPFHERNTPDEQMAAMVSGIPMGRSGTPDECVGTVLFLADPAMSGYVTGQVIEINGGQLTP